MRIYIALLNFLCMSVACEVEKSIVIVIPSYNNAAWYKHNLDSVCFQHYNNYRIIYIDDCSTDGTDQLVQAYIDEHRLHNKVTLLCNQTNYGAMFNHYRAVWMCADDEIILHLDGDDWLKHNDVLNRVNCAYQNPNIWLTYGQFERYPDGHRGYCKPVSSAIIQRNAFRECDWMTSHLRTFYAGLFKQIALKDFVYNGNYFPVTCDMAMFFPLLELAGQRIRCIDEILYVYNEQTDLNDYKTKLLLQLHCDKLIRSRPKYRSAATYLRKQLSDRVDVVLFFNDQPLAMPMLTTFLNSGACVNVLYADEQQSDIAVYKEQYPAINFICYDQDISQIICRIVDQDGYILYVQDTYTIPDALPLHEAINLLEQTQALSFNFTLGQNIHYAQLLKRDQKIPPMVPLSDHYYAWCYKDAEFNWRQPYAQMCLCRKSDMKQLLEGASYAHVDEFIRVLQFSNISLEHMGLCAQQALAYMCNEKADLKQSVSVSYACNNNADALKKFGFMLLN